MARNQLALVAEVEKEREQRRARDFQMAQQQVQLNQQKLAGLEQYRLEYLRQIQQKAASGVGALHFNQHHQFVGKLDKACEQQQLVVNNAKQMAEQRKSLWLKQQQKRKAVELLISKQDQAKAQKVARQEQQMLDEIALQKFIRRQ